jgi:Winged helix-turn helix
MGLIVMSERDLQRIEVLSKVTEGRTTIASAAHVLALSTRQVHRLLDVFEDDGAAAIRHKSRDLPSNNRTSNGVRDYVLTLVREHYLDFGPTLAAEKLAENHSVAISRETLRKWMTEAGIWLSRKQRRTFHQPRLRREAYGELVQIDGSEHRWFEDRNDPCSLLVFIDDATGALCVFSPVSNRKPSDSVPSRSLSRIGSSHRTPIIPFGLLYENAVNWQ